MNNEPGQIPIYLKVLLGIIFTIALLAMPFFLGYGMAYPSVLAWSSVALALISFAGVVVIWLNRISSPRHALLLALVLLVISILSLQLALWHKTRASHADITVHFVRDLNEEYRLLTTLTQAVPPGTSQIDFFHGKYYDRLSNMDYPSRFFVREIPIFEKDQAVMEKDGHYYVDTTGPDYQWDPILVAHFKAAYPAEFEK